MSTIRTPFEVGPTGRIGWASTDYDVMNQRIKTVLLTRIGERVMRPEYGSRLRDNGVFEPIGPDLTLESDIRDALARWEPSITLHEIDVSSSGSLLEVDIQYTLGSTIGVGPTRVRVVIDEGGTVEESA